MKDPNARVVSDMPTQESRSWTLFRQNHFPRTEALDRDSAADNEAIFAVGAWSWDAFLRARRVPRNELLRVHVS